MKSGRFSVSLAIAILAGMPNALQAGEPPRQGTAREGDEVGANKSCPLGKEEFSELKTRLSQGTPTLTQEEKQKLEALRAALEAALGCGLTERVECGKGV